MAISSVCPKCGAITKSGKNSCCGRGGSWFRNCGSAGKAKLDHTWHEGIQACRTRSQLKTASGQQSNAAAHLLSAAGGLGTANSRAVMMDARTFAWASDNSSIPLSVTKHYITPVNASNHASAVIPANAPSKSITTTANGYVPIFMPTPMTATAQSRTLTMTISTRMTAAIANRVRNTETVATDWSLQGTCYNILCYI